MEKEIRLQVADVIINLNLIESKFTDIISRYINSEKMKLVREIVLNSLVVNFSSKAKIIEYILESENIELSENVKCKKAFFKAIRNLMRMRNVIAHSDCLLKIEADIVDVDFDWSYEEGSVMYPVYGPLEPSLAIINEGKVNYQNISKIVDDFSKYFKIAIDGLKEINSKLFGNLSSNSI